MINQKYYDKVKFNPEKFISPNQMNTCQAFAQILGGIILPGDVCTVTRMRNITAEIAGRPTLSPLALNALFSFESPDAQGNTLNLGETVILQEEINLFITVLRALGIQVTALHNHWLFEEPRLMYIHFFSIENPLTFARKVALAFSIIENGVAENVDEFVRANLENM